MLASLKLCASVVGARMKSFFSKENGEVNIVAIVVLCGIAVLLAIIFREGISKILQSLFGTIETKANEAMQG